MTRRPRLFNWDKMKIVKTTILCLTLSLLSGLPLYAQKFSPETFEFLQARFAAENGDFDAALQHLDRVIQSDPGNPVLLYERATILLDQSKVEQAEKELRKIVAISPDFFDAQRLLGRILLERSKGDDKMVDEALGHLEAAFKLQPDDISTGLTMGQIYLQSNRLEDAARIFAQLVERAPDNRLLNYNYAQILAKLGRADESKPYLERVVAADPTFAPAVSQLADMYESAGEWEKAAALLQPLIERDTLNSELQRRQAYDYLRGGDAAKARDLLEKILAVYPKDRPARTFLGEALSDLGEHEKADQIFTALLEEQPDDFEVLVSSGFNQIASRQFDRAAATFKSILALRDLNAQGKAMAETQLAAIDHARGNYDAALERAKKLVQGPKEVNRQAVNIALDVLRRQQRYGEGLALIEPLAKGSDDPFLQARYIEFLFRAGKDAQAKAVAKADAAKDDDSAQMVAEVYATLHKYAEAIDIYETLQKKNPADLDLLFQLGSAYERAGRFQEAEHTFLQVLSKDPAHAATLNYLGYMWADRGVNLQKAADLLVKAVKLEPRNGAFVDSLGWVYFRLDKLDLAEKYLLDASHLLPQDPTVQEHLGDLFAKQGEYDKAAERYRSALQLDPEAEESTRIQTKLSQTEHRTASAQ
ncbi:MAG: tetratricopeptide repeat protein [Thermoanaerobaculia bacterium]